MEIVTIFSVAVNRLYISILLAQVQVPIYAIEVTSIVLRLIPSLSIVFTLALGCSHCIIQTTADILAPLYSWAGITVVQAIVFEASIMYTCEYNYCMVYHINDVILPQNPSVVTYRHMYTLFIVL